MPLLLSIMLTILVGDPPGSDLDKVRQVFHEAVMDTEKIRDFHEYIWQIEENDPVIYAYQAASEAMLTQLSWNPFKKYDQIKKYDEIMMEAVSEDSANIEIRFIRLSIEYHIPKFLGMSDHLESDRDYIMENLQNVSKLELDPDFTRYILYFMAETGLCDEKKLARIEAQLPVH